MRCEELEKFADLEPAVVGGRRVGGPVHADLGVLAIGGGTRIRRNGFQRGSSTSRTDRGNGACETIYIDIFEVIEPATSYWRISMWSSLALLLTGLVVHFSRPYRPH